jgi:hypothetical protein
MFFFINKKLPLILIYIFSLTKISNKQISFAETSTQICSATTYDNTSVTDECLDGPSKRNRIVGYRTFEEYILDHSFKHNGLPFYSSLYVDSDYHNLGDFMNGGMVIYVLLIISIILLAAWIPIICCWKHEVCLFDECCIQNNCCFILWNFIIYVVLAAVLSFIIVCIIFAE